MNLESKFPIWLACAVAGIVAALAVGVGIIVAGLPDQDGILLLRLIEAHPIVFGAVAASLSLVGAGLLAWLVAKYALPIRSITEEIRLISAANPGYRVRPKGGSELVELAKVINRLADAYLQLQNELERRIGDSNRRLEEERNRLAALMSELSDGVLLCNVDGGILLYNKQAKAMFGSAGQGSGAQGGLVGLGRSIFRLFDREPIAHALGKLQFSLDQGAEFPVTRFVAGAVTGALVRVRMAPSLTAGGSIGGMLLTLEDVTEPMGNEYRQRERLRAFAAGVRAPLADLCATAENLGSFPGMDEVGQTLSVKRVAAESRRLSAMINDWLSGYADTLKAGLALEDMRVADLLNFARRRIEAVLGLPCGSEPVPDGIWIRVDSFALVEALAFLAGNLRDDYGVRSVGLRAASDGHHAEVDLVWSGAIVARDAISLWETLPMQIGSQQTPLTLKDVLERHGAEVGIQSNKTTHTAWFRLLLPLGTPATLKLRRTEGVESRPEFYDFDLFRHVNTSQDSLDQRLVDLTYTVFDTETTGLEPSAGDEIISLGAVRIVNGRLLKTEVFEQLIDPQRPVGRSSSLIHGIETDALLGQPTIRQVLPQFHQFSEDSVLVAHNAAFDMRFLELKEAQTGVRFVQPVLDTLLLSVIVHPSLQGHNLEAIAGRLGIGVVGRHTALGDALLTGEIFLRLLPLLAEQGILTLGQALEASRKSYYARLQY